MNTIEHSPVYLDTITFTDPSIEAKFLKTQLYTDTHNRFTHILSSTGTNYASYLIISPLIISTPSGPIEPKDTNMKNQGWILDARVIAKSRNNYREYDLKTIITDWKK
jgi:hypothetical protein